MDLGSDKAGGRVRLSDGQPSQVHVVTAGRCRDSKPQLAGFDSLSQRHLTVSHLVENGTVYPVRAGSVPVDIAISESTAQAKQNGLEPRGGHSARGSIPLLSSILALSSNGRTRDSQSRGRSSSLRRASIYRALAETVRRTCLSSRLLRVRVPYARPSWG